MKTLKYLLIFVLFGYSCHLAMAEDLSLIGSRIPIKGSGSARVAFKYIKTVQEYDMEYLLMDVAASKKKTDISAEQIENSVKLLSILTALPPSQNASTEKHIVYYAYSQTNQTASTRTQVKVTYFTNQFYTAPTDWAALFSLIPDRVQICRDGQKYYKYSKKEPWEIYSARGGAIPRFEIFGHTVFTKESDLRQTNCWTITNKEADGIIVYVYRSPKGGALATEIGLEIASQPPHHILRTWYGSINSPWKEYVYSDYLPVANGRYYPRYTRIRKIIPLESGPFIAEEKEYTVLGNMISFSPPDGDAKWFNHQYWNTKYLDKEPTPTAQE